MFAGDAPTWDELMNSDLDGTASEKLADALMDNVANDSTAWLDALEGLGVASTERKSRDFITKRLARCRVDVAEDLADDYHDRRNWERAARRSA
jgi:hypothetical protein